MKKNEFKTFVQKIQKFCRSNKNEQIVVKSTEI